MLTLNQMRIRIKALVDEHLDDYSYNHEDGVRSPLSEAILVDKIMDLVRTRETPAPGPQFIHVEPTGKGKTHTIVRTQESNPRLGAVVCTTTNRHNAEQIRSALTKGN